jgi:acetyl-CoA acyltransferase
VSGWLGNPVLVVDAVRSPIGRLRGGLSSVRPDDLAAAVLRALLARHPDLPGAAVDDVVLGGANQAGEDNRNVGRMAALLAGLPTSVPGATTNRLCGSGLEAVLSAGRSVAVGDARIVVAGGVESMSRAPFVLARPTQALPGSLDLVDSRLGWRLVNPAMPNEWTVSLGETAERVAERYGVSREDQDALALRSHQRALAAVAAGAFDREIVPIETATGEVVADEGPRADTSAEALAALRPVFRKDGTGTVTAGNSSPLNDGAAALLLASADAVEEHGLPVLGRIVAGQAVGVDPDVMGIGPLPATTQLLERLGWTVSDLAAIELNEAFAAQGVAVLRGLGLADDDPRVNALGGAIALGHPLGCTGARLVTTLLHRLRAHGGGRGVATLCIGVGQGLALAVEA